MRDTIATWRRSGALLDAEPDLRLQIAAAPDDPAYADQWNLTGSYSGGPAYGIGVEAAWSVTPGSSTVTVAVLDTGVLAHPDLTGRVLAGYDFVSDPFVARDGGGRDVDPSDPGDWTTGSEGCGAAKPSSWHGTHVAGTIGAATDNGLGVAGVDRAAALLPLRVLGRCGGVLSDVADALRWAAGLPVPGVPANPTPAAVANLSVSGSGACPAAMQAAIDDAYGAGTTVVVAAGNHGVDLSVAPKWPATCERVVSVAAVTRYGDLATYSNRGPVTLAAPGGEMVTGQVDELVLSLFNTGTTSPVVSGMVYAWSSGTSMATPHVSGVVALMKAANPSLGPAPITTLLRATASLPPASPRGAAFTCGIACGAGLLDAGAAVTWASLAGTIHRGQDLRADHIRIAGDDSLYGVSAGLAALYNTSVGCPPDQSGTRCSFSGSTLAGG